jgi:hypothetical protein
VYGKIHECVVFPCFYYMGKLIVDCVWCPDTGSTPSEAPNAALGAHLRIRRSCPAGEGCVECLRGVTFIRMGMWLRRMFFLLHKNEKGMDVEVVGGGRRVTHEMCNASYKPVPRNPTSRWNDMVHLASLIPSVTVK